MPAFKSFSPRGSSKVILFCLLVVVLLRDSPIDRETAGSWKKHSKNRHGAPSCYGGYLLIQRRAVFPMFPLSIITTMPGVFFFLKVIAGKALWGGQRGISVISSSALTAALFLFFGETVIIFLDIQTPRARPPFLSLTLNDDKSLCLCSKMQLRLKYWYCSLRGCQIGRLSNGLLSKREMGNSTRRDWM